ncbi:MAG: YbhN family protein [Thermoanaerobaculales bacterium]
MTTRRWKRWLLGVCGLGLLAGLLVVARPSNVVHLAKQAEWSGLLVAFAWAVALAALRGLRLSMVSGGRLSVGPGLAVAAAGQLAVGVLPLRLGEVALVPLLAAAGVPGTVRGLSLLVVVRVLDLGAVLCCAVGVAFVVGRSPTVAGVTLLALVVATVVAWQGGTAVLGQAVRRWRARRNWTRRLLRQLLQVRRELRALGRAPGRALACLVLSLLIWSSIWALTVALLRAMHIGWPPGAVLLGVLGATVASSLPINAFGNFGTQEAGWSAALAGVGVDPAGALAAGFATHLWTLVFQAVLGAVAILYLAARQSGRRERTLRASVTSFLSSRRDP